MRIEKIAVNKALAEEWLNRNIESNRSISPSRVRRMAGDMSAGRWLRNSETIKFDTTGRLVDGQHRLKAIALADVVVDLDVALDIPENVIHTIDQGRARSASDVLFMRGKIGNRVLAAASKIALNYLDGVSVNYGRTNADVVTFVERFPAIEAYATRLTSLRNQVPPSALAAVAFLGSADGSRTKLVDAFLTGIETGANLDEGDARLALIRSIANTRGRQSTTKSLDPQYVFHVTVRAWNAYVEGRPLQSTRFSKSRHREYITPDVRGGPRAGSGVEGLRLVIDEGRTFRTLSKNRT